MILETDKISTKNKLDSSPITNYNILSLLLNIKRTIAYQVIQINLLANYYDIFGGLY